MIYILPGMGADSRMYSGPWRKVPNTRFPDWPEYQKEQTLSQVADRILQKCGIGPDDTVAGSSMGGMVALEIAAKLGNKRVFLFGSAVSNRELNPLLHRMASLVKKAPIPSAQRMAAHLNNPLMKMFSQADAEFMRAMCFAVAQWRGFTGDPQVIRRIHGARDKILSCHGQSKIIPDAGHLIAVTHAAECIALMHDDLD